MKVAVVGSRNYKILSKVGFFVRQLEREIIIVSGGARGVDREAEKSAVQTHKGVEIYPVNAPDKVSTRQFAVLAKARNTLIVEAADIVVAFWNGFSGGTLDSITKARSMGKPVHIISENASQQYILDIAKEINALLVRPKVTIFCDGGCSPNPGNGGIGIVLLMPEKNARKEFSESIGESTNQIAEIVAATRALELLKRPCEVTLYSDSAYLIRTMKGEYRRKTNLEYWKRLDEAIGDHIVEWNWVQGHDGNSENERADKLAYQAARGGY